MSEPTTADVPAPSKYAQDLIDQGMLTLAEYYEYAALKIEKHQYRERLCITSPTWCMREGAEDITLDKFLLGLCEPSTRDKDRRDYANIPGGSLRPFIMNSKILDDHAIEDMESPIIGDSQNMQAGASLNLKDTFKPIPHAVYCVASDYSTVSDATGIACTHFDQTTNEFVLDFTIRIKAKKGERVDYEPIRNLIRTMRNTGFRIGWVGFDQHQSNDSAVMLEKEGFRVEIVKYADSVMGCSTVRDFVLNKKIRYGTCDSTFIGEAKELQIINDKRVDHLKNGGSFNSKDVWDAVVNSVYLTLQIVQEEHGEFLQLSDVRFFDKSDVMYVHPLSEEQKILPKETLEKLQLPTTKHALIAFANCRFHLEKDSDMTTVVVAAVPVARTGGCHILEAYSMRRTPESLSELFVEISNKWTGKGFFRTRKSQPVEFYTGDLPFLPKLEEALFKKAPDLAITPLSEELSQEMRIKGAQSEAREGRVLFPKDYSSDPWLRTLVGQLVAYPFIPSAYLLLALEGVVRAGLEVDFTTSTLKSKNVLFTLGSSKEGW